jgi:hypothetical protein
MTSQQKHPIRMRSFADIIHDPLLPSEDYGEILSAMGTLANGLMPQRRTPEPSPDLFVTSQKTVLMGLASGAETAALNKELSPRREASLLDHRRNAPKRAGIVRPRCAGVLVGCPPTGSPPRAGPGFMHRRTFPSRSPEGSCLPKSVDCLRMDRWLGCVVFGTGLVNGRRQT